MRGDGATTRQMQAAASGAVFIWVNHHIDYPKQLARKLERDDLRIVGPDWLEHGWQGLELSGIVVDHAAYLNERQRDNLTRAMTRVRASHNTAADRESSGG